ncbi:hypothetical protein PTKIN_Ptkin09bG0245500 [Pterospermum kingtungense]
MGVYLAFYFTLLLWLIQAVEPRCNETCGGVTIPYPFGIKTGCYTNSWFRVTCNETAHHGPKPFISRINLELIDLFGSDGDTVGVNNPVTYLNCGNKVNNCTTAPAAATAGVSLQGSPFFFPSNINMFGSVGCGNWVSVFSDIRTEPVAGCLQPRCGDQVTSKLGGCYAQISQHLVSYDATMREISNPGKLKFRNRSCTSAFVFDLRIMLNSSGPYLEFPDRIISIHTTHVPATLAWNPVNCDLEAERCQELEPSTPVPHKYVCKEKCGDVDIPYPFGMKVGCYMNDWFKVTCNQTCDGPKPFIGSINLQLLSVSFHKGTVVVNNPITYSNCQNKDEDNDGVSVNLTGTPFYFSDISNVFVSVGCGSLVTISRNSNDYPFGGCPQPNCSSVTMTSIVSCITKIPLGLGSFAVNMTGNYPSNSSKRSCGSAFLVDESMLNPLWTKCPDCNGLSSWTNVFPIQQQWIAPKVGHLPTTLQWGIPKSVSCELKEGSNSKCSSDGQYCWSKISSMHLCVCSIVDDFFTSGNDHSIDVCQGKGNCSDAKYKYCHLLCLNAPGHFCSSARHDRYEYSTTDHLCKSIALTSSPDQIPMKKPKMSSHQPFVIGCSTSVGTAIALLSAWRVYKVLKRSKSIQLKQKYFRMNGGLILQRKLFRNEGNVEKIRLFTSKELKKATDYFNVNRIIGQGGQGTVYKGMLADGSIVAIKKSKMVEEKNVDGKKLEQFISEVMILSQINHRNVVKLLGCCLETKFPLLVYEFIPNGTLSQLLHDQNEEFPITWEMRLRIAIETANALSYLHSAASVPVYHRDIKSNNILLDDKYIAKVSDFGISRLVALEKTHLTTRVQGTFGYMDPEYFQSGQFTDKSDVYSFGVVLVELLTGKKHISSTESEEARSLASFFLHSMKENSLFDILDQMAMKDGPLEEIIAVAKLAKRCLNLNGKKRPTMKQVAMELEGIKLSEEANDIQQKVDADLDIDDEIEPLAIAFFSTSSIIKDSVILSLDA